MIILRFGKSGRVAQICKIALQLAFPNVLVYTANRANEFVADTGEVSHCTLDSLLDAHSGENFIWLDASIDHSSTDNLIAHETFKRKTLSSLSSKSLLHRAIGISSGITLMPVSRIEISASHMLEYRRQKVAQEHQFFSLNCPILLPNIFTLIGPFTYRGQSAAWAQILKARIDRGTNTVLNEPHARKAWTSEFHVFQTVLSFLTASGPFSYAGALVSGSFTLADLACTDALPLPPLAYKVGNSAGWLMGDYLPPAIPSNDHPSIVEALLRSICE